MNLKTVKNKNKITDSFRRINDATSAELKKLAEERGLVTEGLSVAGIEYELAKSLWEEEHPGEPMPEQVSPMLIHDLTSQGKDYVDKKLQVGQLVYPKED